MFLKAEAHMRPLAFHGHNQYSSTTNSARPMAPSRFLINGGFYVCRMIHFVWFVEQGCSDWYSVMISEEYFYFQGNAYDIAWRGAICIFSKKTNLLLGRWSSPHWGVKGGLILQLVNQWSLGLERPYGDLSALQKRKTNLTQGPRGFRQSQLPQKIFGAYM